MKSWFIYWCSITTSFVPCEQSSGAIQIDEFVTAYIHPYGYTDFEIIEAEFSTEESFIKYKNYKTINRGIFHLKHPHGFGVMHVTRHKVVLFVSLTYEGTRFQDTQIFTRKNSTRTCKCKN